MLLAATEGGFGFETRITRMVTNLLAIKSIGLGQFVRARLAHRSLCAKAGEIRVVAPAWECPRSPESRSRAQSSVSAHA